MDSAHLHTQTLWVMKLASHFNLKWTLERRRGEKPVCWACNALFHFKTMIPCSLHAKPRLPGDVVLPFFICLFCFLYKMFSVKSMGLVCPKTTNKFNIKKNAICKLLFFSFFFVALTIVFSILTVKRNYKKIYSSTFCRKQ